MERVFVIAALISLAVYFSSELIMRKGKARAWKTGPYDRRTSKVLQVLVPLLLFGSVPARHFLNVGRMSITLALGLALISVILAGVVLRYWSMSVLGEHFTRTLVVLPGQRVVHSGPYRFIRHPGYLAQLITITPAMTVFSGNWLFPIFVLASLLTAYRFRIRAEEAMLVDALGEPYREYQAHTWRLLPGLY